LNLNELKDLLQILDEKHIDEFELEEEGMKLRIRKAAPPGSNHSSPAQVALHAALPFASIPVQPAATAPASGPAAGSAGQSRAAAHGAAPSAEDSDLALAKSPIVGTFYRSPDPNAPVFVNVGDRVRVGQVLCIIEAMKLMNEIEAEVAGEIRKIFVENGQPVQFGDTLFAIAPER
jgi:acetyl-CoA carboxylase biotin carboxyl carrier protein